MLPISDLSARDSALGLWATFPFLDLIVALVGRHSKNPTRLTDIWNGSTGT
ncbi:MAG: hypothetical protein ABI690_25565 [Chloroflexota bacterium]